MREDLPRFKDKLAIVGFASTTRAQAPFDDDEYEIWTLNEAGNTAIDSFKWVKRFDRLFQIHPRWDFARDNNSNDPNHFKWLKNETGPCLMCGATGKIKKKEVEEVCPACVNGVYTPPITRSWAKVIYMQAEWDDIPQSVMYPLKEMVALNPRGEYFDSSLAFMIMKASTMGYKEIFVVGFEMAAQSEYFYQRCNFEYLIGILSARGQVFRFPENTSLLTGQMYGYKNMKTGYRQQLDMRLAVLNNQLTNQNFELAKLEGELTTWKNLMTLGALTGQPMEMFSECQKKYGKKLALVNIIKGSAFETENLRKLYDKYFLADALDGKTNIREANDEHITIEYQAE